SPAKFDPDPNQLMLPTNLPPATNWSRRVLINTNPPPATPDRFNPDPGAMLRTNSQSSPVFFQTDPALLPDTATPVVPAERVLPRAPTSSGEIVTPQPTAAGSFNREPLPPNQELPR